MTAHAQFTERETAVKELIAAGHTSSEIAAKLDMSELAVAKLRSRINKKLGIVGRDALLQRAKAARLLLNKGVEPATVKSTFERNARILGYISAAVAHTKAAQKSYPKYPDAVLELLGNASASIERASYHIRNP